jgi:hypothetical protein
MCRWLCYGSATCILDCFWLLAIVAAVDAVSLGVSFLTSDSVNKHLSGYG